MSDVRLVTGVVDTAFGWVGIAKRGKYLVGLTLPMMGKNEAQAAIGQTRGAVQQVDGDVDDIGSRIRAYFRGEVVEFDDLSLDPSLGTPFQRRVWRATRAIPRGETRTYGELARECGSPGAARAVGQAMARNPWPVVVPCHRVVGHDGHLTGFGGGIDMKQRMLRLEKQRTLRQEQQREAE